VKRYIVVLAVAGMAALSAPLSAQGAQDPVPPEYRPPAGMCRIWLNGVPPSRQPEPTDCPTAVRRVPPNGRVVFGPEPQRPAPPPDPNPPKKGGDTPPVKRLKPEERRKPEGGPAIDIRRVPLPRGIHPRG
jgi:hypothetical protein